MGRIENTLATMEKARGIGVVELSRIVGVSRQTLYAIEAGKYNPNTGIGCA